MIDSTLPSIVIFFLCFLISLTNGYWLGILLVPGNRTLKWFVLTITFGLGALVLLTANLNYLGVPVRSGGPAAILFLSILSAVTLWRNPSRKPVITLRECLPLGVCFLGIILFVTPYSWTGAFPFFGDSYSNCAVADFVRDRGYHASPEPIHEELWKTQMWSFGMGHIRMGFPYLLAITGTLLGVNAYWTYVGVCCFLLLLCLLSFHILAADILGNNRWSLLAAGTFSCNQMMVHWSAAIGFVPQTIGIGIACLLLWSGFRLGEGGLRTAGITGLLLAMEIAFYPEILPFVLVPLVAVILFNTFRGNAPFRATAIGWARAIGILILINGYNCYYAALGYVAVFRGRPMGGTGLGMLGYLTMSFGLFSFSTPSPLLLWISVLLTAILVTVCLLGWSRMRGRGAHLVVAALLICSPVGAWMWYSGSEYSVYKVVLYLFYLVPLGTAAGFAWLWAQAKPIRLATGSLGVLWLILSAYLYTDFGASAYGILKDPTYRTRSGNPAEYMHDFTTLEGLERVTAPRGKTLLLLPDTLSATWVSYFFRAPSHLYFLGVYSEMLSERPSPPSGSFSHILAERGSSMWLPSSLPLFENNRYTLLPAQPVVTLGDKGWYKTEFIGGEAVHWMQDDASLVAYSPKTALVILEAETILGPHGTPRDISLVADGESVGQFHVPSGKTSVRTPTLRLRSGFTHIELHSNAKTPQIGADTRKLNVLFGSWKLHLVEYPAGETDGELSLSMQGATADQWVTPAGVTLVPNKRASYRRLHLEIEVPNVTGLLPLVVNAVAANGVTKNWAITTPGRYKVFLELPRPGEGELRLAPTNYFIPRDVGANTDTRQLSFRILSVIPLS